MHIKEAKKRIQAISMFLNLHTLARNARHYTPLNDDNQPVSEEMRTLDTYVSEIDRHGARKLMRRMLQEIKID